MTAFIHIRFCNGPPRVRSSAVQAVNANSGTRLKECLETRGGAGRSRGPLNLKNKKASSHFLFSSPSSNERPTSLERPRPFRLPPPQTRVPSSRSEGRAFPPRLAKAGWNGAALDQWPSEGGAERRAGETRERKRRVAGGKLSSLGPSLCRPPCSKGPSPTRPDPVPGEAAARLGFPQGRPLGQPARCGERGRDSKSQHPQPGDGPARKRRTPTPLQGGRRNTWTPPPERRRRGVALPPLPTPAQVAFTRRV